MNAIALLTGDHNTVRRLFREFKATGEHAKSRRQAIANRIFKALDVHTKIEEEIFYPAVRTSIPDAISEVAEAIAEHKVVDGEIALLRVMSPDDEGFDAKFQKLVDNVEHHAGEEEREMFPKARTALGAELSRLGAEMGKRKRELEKSYDAPLTGVLRKAKTLVARAFDALGASSDNPTPRRSRPTTTTPRRAVTRSAPAKSHGPRKTAAKVVHLKSKTTPRSRRSSSANAPQRRAARH